MIHQRQLNSVANVIRSLDVNALLRETETLAQQDGCDNVDEVRSRYGRLRELCHSELSPDEAIGWLPRVGALVVASMRQTLGISLYQTQLHAGWLIAGGQIAEMQTGEGKTYACLLPACVMAMSARGVHVACPNDYLADRDHELLRPALASLGLSSGSLVGDADATTKRSVYRRDVVYAAAHTFGFDFLRDQLSLQTWKDDSLVNHLLRSASGCSSATPMLQRPLHAAIVDEADHVLLDDAMSPMLLSTSTGAEAADANVHRTARAMASELVLGEDYLLHREMAEVQFTRLGFDSLYKNCLPNDDEHLRRPWHDYVAAAIRAQDVFTNDHDYVVRGNEIQIVDRTTGRIYADRTWSDGLHQAIECKEGLAISTENDALRRTTRQQFFQRYEWLGGMTGTAGGCAREFENVYGAPVQTVDLRVHSGRLRLSDAVFDTQDEKHTAIAEEAKRCQAIGRSVLIGTLSIQASRTISAALTSLSLTHRVLNGLQDADEADIITMAGQPFAITVATSLAGRGTDIKLADSVRKAGGLHVIVSQHHRLSRVDRQLVGRCARAGDPGTVRFFLSAEDELSTKFAPWLQPILHRHALQNPFATIADEVAFPVSMKPSRVGQHIIDVQRVLQADESRQRFTALHQQLESDRWQSNRDAYSPAATFA